MFAIDSAALPGTPPVERAFTGVPVRDLRGIRSHDDSDPVLLDVSGRRARGLRRGGRVVGVLFLAWFCGLILAGLGLLPADQLPFGSAVAPATSPPALAVKPRPAPVAPADLRPAAPAVVTSRGAVSAGSGAAATTAPRVAPSRSAGTAGPKRHHAASSVSPAFSGAGTLPVSPSATTPATGNKATAPGAIKHVSPVTGRPVATTTTTSTTTTTTTPGSSASAPGHATTRPGHGASALTP